jgi:hypothetical protein
MFDFGYWIGPLIAVVLALCLRAALLISLAGAAMIGFFISFSASATYGECDPCSTKAEALFSLNTILLTTAPALFLLGVAKAAVYAWLRPRRVGSEFSAKPS